MAEETVKTTETNSKKGLLIGGIIAAIAVVIAAIIIFAIVKPFAKVNLVGKYDLTSMESNGEDQAETISLMKAFGMTATIEVVNDKEGKISMFGDEAKFTYDNEKFHFEKSEKIVDDEDEEDVEDDEEIEEEESSFAGADAKYEFKDDKLTLIYEEEKDGEKNTEKLIFTKQKAE